MYEKPMLREIAFDAAECACQAGGENPPPGNGGGDGGGGNITDMFANDCWSQGMAGVRVGGEEGGIGVEAAGLDVVCVIEDRTGLDTSNMNFPFGNGECYGIC